MTELLPWYFAYSINTNFVTKAMQFENFMPVHMDDYTTFKQEFDQQYGKIHRESWMIEHATLQWNWWIWLAHPEWNIHISQDFIAYEIIGDYSQMQDAYAKIMQDYPQAKDYYNLYLTDPSITPIENNRTRILVQVD